MEYKDTDYADHMSIGRSSVILAQGRTRSFIVGNLYGATQSEYDIGEREFDNKERRNYTLPGHPFVVIRNDGDDLCLL